MRISDFGHICDGNRGHYAGDCPKPSLVPPDQYATERGKITAPLKNRMGDPEWAAKKARGL